jgi:hypothetical protein
MICKLSSASKIERAKSNPRLDVLLKHPSLTTNQGEKMPRKGYKRQAGRSVGMPERIEAQNFNRRISANEALILATAGDGSKTDGFRNLLCLYRELHNIGYRCSMDLAAFMAAVK